MSIFQTSDFDYALPQDLIAQTPITRRDQSRLMVVDRSAGSIAHHHFHDLPHLLAPGDLLVTNDSRVIRARLIGEKAGTGGKVEVLLLRELAPGRWEALVKPGRRIGVGQRLVFGAGALEAVVTDRAPGGVRVLEFSPRDDFWHVLESVGMMPLPPYIRRPLADLSRYQTIYARHRGSVAAPTAGLHFTQEVLAALAALDIHMESVTLHVGLGTFRPVTAERIEDHRMEAEWYQVPQAAAAAVAAAQSRGGRIVAVGTTATRTLESAADAAGRISAHEGTTRLFITPGYRFKAVEALLTNFHLPRSTLLMLVSALAGSALIREAYQSAVAERYRFFSFGDAMLIV